MIEYEHGDWYCKPANEEEAREIVERAVLSGAVRDEIVGDLQWDDCDAWGVVYGRTYTGGVDHAGQSFYGKTQYTLGELRQKFPLPGERVEPEQWNGEGLPPVGTVCEIEWSEYKWIPIAILLVTDKSIVVRKLTDFSERLIGIDEKLNFRPLRTEREKFVESCLGIVPHNTSEADYLYMAADKIYDAIKSGKLKAPEAE